MNTTDTSSSNRTPAARLEELFEAHGERLFRFAALRTGSRAEAEDIVQETFLKLFRSGAEPHNPAAYLYRSVANACTDRLRRSPRTEPLPASLAAPEADDSLAEEAARCARLLDRLPEEQAETIRLHLFASLRFREIAEVQQCPLPTVKARFRYGIEKLRTLVAH